MLRKFLLGAVAAVGFGAQSASAAPPVEVQPGVGGGYFPPSYPRPFPTYPPTFPPRRDAHDYAVFVKHGHHWDRYGRYETLREAERVERHLELRGFRARVEVIHDHR